MQVTASWGGESVAVEVDAECRSVEGLKRCLQEALPEVDVEAVRLEVCGRPVDDEAVLGLVEGSVVNVSASQAALAAAALREEGRGVDYSGFRDAAIASDVRLCKLYLEAGVIWPPERETPLHIAVRRDCQALYELLVTSGCDKEAKDYTGCTALHFAVHAGNVQAAQFLLDAGCDKEATNDFGDTPLHWEIGTFSDVTLAKLLVDAGCKKDVKNKAGDTPLHIAASHGRIAVCRLLLDAGWAKNEENNSGHTPLHRSIEGFHTSVTELFLDAGCEMDEKAKRLVRDRETRAKHVEQETITAGCCVLC